MNKNKLYSTIENHIQNNFWLYVISGLCLCVGIILGIYTVKYMGDTEKNELLSYLENFTKVTTVAPISNKAVFLQSVSNNIPMILAIWFLGLTIIGVPLILLINLLKGFTIGFTTSFMIHSLGLRGIWITIFAIVPQNIIFIPCVLISSVIATEFSLLLLQDKMNRQWTTNMMRKIASYTLTFVFIFVIMFVGFVVEGYITPNMLKLIVINIGSGGN